MKKTKHDHRGSKNPAWRGGRVKLKTGYIVIHSPHHPFRMKGKNPWVYEHRLVMEKYIGRFLQPKEIVHHLNHEKDDNRIENLELLTSQSVHVLSHHRPKTGKFFKTHVDHD